MNDRQVVTPGAPLSGRVDTPQDHDRAAESNAIRLNCMVQPAEERRVKREQALSSRSARDHIDAPSVRTEEATADDVVSPTDPSHHDAAGTRFVDPTEVTSFVRFPVVVLRRASLSGNAKTLYAYLIDRWRMNRCRPFQAKEETARDATGLGRDAYRKALQSLEDAGLIKRIKTGRANAYRLLPISDQRDSCLSDERVSRRSIGTELSSEACTPVPSEPAVRSADDDYDVKLGQQLLAEAGDEGDTLVEEIQALGYAFTDARNSERQGKNRHALYARLVALARDGDVRDPVGWLLGECGRIRRRRVKPIDRTLYVAALIHHGVQPGMEDLYRRHETIEEEEGEI
jgi:hypothetical protein